MRQQFSLVPHVMFLHDDVFLDDDAYGCHDFYLYAYRYLNVMITVHECI